VDDEQLGRVGAVGHSFDDLPPDGAFAGGHRHTQAVECLVDPMDSGVVGGTHPEHGTRLTDEARMFNAQCI
jgi:hypothetical protein